MTRSTTDPAIQPDTPDREATLQGHGTVFSSSSSTAPLPSHIQTNSSTPPASAGPCGSSPVTPASHLPVPTPHHATEGQRDSSPGHAAAVPSPVAIAAQPSRDFTVPSTDSASTAPFFQGNGVTTLCDCPTSPADHAVLLTLRSVLLMRDSRMTSHRASLDELPNEVLFHILGFLEVPDLLATSRTSHHLRDISLAPVIHALRLRHARAAIPPLLANPTRPTLADLIARHIFLTRTTIVSRKLARSLVSIRLSRRLAVRPSPEALVQRAVLPKECAPGIGHVSPALVAKKRAIERERVKDTMRRWVGGVWKGEVSERSEGVRRREETAGVGRVWRLRRFWERLSRGGDGVAVV